MNVHTHVHLRVEARGPAHVRSLGATHLGLEAGSSLPWSPPSRLGYLVSQPWVLSHLYLTRAGASKHVRPYLTFSRLLLFSGGSRCFSWMCLGGKGMGEGWGGRKANVLCCCAQGELMEATPSLGSWHFLFLASHVLWICLS